MVAHKKKHVDSVKETKEEIVSPEQKSEDLSFENITKVVIIVIGVILLGLAIWAYTVYSSAKYDYMGVEFNKVQEGKIDFYTAKVPAIDNAGNIVSYESVDFRSNPKSLGNIPIDIQTSIKFLRGKTVFVSVPENLSNCQGYSGVALINFGRFLALFGLNAQGAVDDKSYANNTNTPYVNCKTHPNNTVIIVKDGSETKIEQTGNNCYEISFTDCEVLRAVERFELQVMSVYMEKINANKA